MVHYKVIVEQHHDGYVVYPVGLKGAIVAEGNYLKGAVETIVSNGPLGFFPGSESKSIRMG
jgi:hypothetical protein